jgi:hypothetical protein
VKGPTVEELIANIREARARMQALLADPDLEWERALPGDTTVRRTVEHAIESDVAFTRQLLLTIEAPDAPEYVDYSFDTPSAALAEYERVAAAFDTALDRLDEGDVAREVPGPAHAFFGVLNAILIYAVHHTNVHWLQIKGL